MAQTLVSPGVQVTVIDESQYLPAATNSVPLVIIATASNKISGDGTGVAPGTLAANADQLFLATSQRALSAQFGVPFFYETSNGTQINGYELNEYGLLAAYSALGVTNQCYVVRANVDLAALTASLSRPVGSADNGAYWLDTTNTQWGLFQWNQANSSFTNQLPLVITDTDFLATGTSIPLQSYGSIGQYAAVTTSILNPVYYKRGGPTSTQSNDASITTLYNTWVLVGSNDWQTSWATVQGQNTPAVGSLIAGDTFTINSVVITVPNAPNNTVTGISNQIYAAGITGVHAANIGGALNLYCDSTAVSAGGVGTITLAQGAGDSFITLGLTEGTYAAPAFQASPSFTVPQWSTFSAGGGRPTGSVWQKTSNVNQGTNLVVKKYNSTLGTWITQPAPVYPTSAQAIYALDPTGGGKNIPVGTTYARSQPTNTNISSLEILERGFLGATVIAGSTTTQTFVVGNSFQVRATEPESATLTIGTAILTGTTPSDFVSAVSALQIPYVSASVESNGTIVFTHSAGGDIYLVNTIGTPVTTAGFTTATPYVRPFYFNGQITGVALSNWQTTPYFTYTASNTAPDQDPADGTYWYYSDPTQVDIMIQQSGEWQGYQNVTNDARGYNLTLTNATGPIISATPPLTQTDDAQSPLVFGDLWVDTSDLENYPKLYRWQPISGVDQWVQIDNTNATESNGVLFADARWATNGVTDPVAGAFPAIAGVGGLSTSNYLDPDAPNPLLYPQGILLFNTRRSGFNVKTYQANYFNTQAFPTFDWVSTQAYTIGERVSYLGLNYVAIANSTNAVPSASSSANIWSFQDVTSTWLSATGSRSDGSPYMGRQSQRKIIVTALQVAIDSNAAIREEQNVYNLIAVPGYPELADNMRALNNEINNVAFNIVDTPMRLPGDAQSLINWATNNNGLGTPEGDGNLAQGDPYSAAFYPSCTTTDTTGNLVVTAPSHMMIRTIIRNDQVAYPWLAPAGTRRGLVDNALQIGYIDSATGLFEPLGVGQTMRDILYSRQINPITFIPGVGITNFGNKTLQGNTTALDRINVARLVAFLRARLETIGKQYLFEPNDQITRNEIKNSIDSLMIDLVAKRGIYDYLVVCDLSNNTPTTIDQNQLYVDIAIEPVKAVEFIYIPLRIQNTGEIASASAG